MAITSPETYWWKPADKEEKLWITKERCYRALLGESYNQLVYKLWQIR